MTEWLEEYGPRLYRFAWRLSGDAHLAEDLAQETLLRAWRSRENLRDPTRRRVWLFRICANLWRDEGRRQKARGPRLSTDATEHDRAMQYHWHNPTEASEETAVILAAITNLPDRQREALHLAACEGLNAIEIAEVLETTPGAIRSSLSLARQNVRRELERREEAKEISHEC